MQPSQPRLRDARREDASTIWAIRTRGIVEVCSQVYSPEQIAAWASTPMPEAFPELVARVPFVVAEWVDTGRMAGFAGLNVERSEVEAVFVDPSELRSGVGRALLVELERRARAAGLRALTLLASLNSVPFYEAGGYRRLRTETFRHPSGLELPSFRMGKDLI